MVTLKNYNPLYEPKKQTLYGFIGRTLILWVGEVLGFILIAHLSVGLSINDWETAVVVVSILGIINALF